MLLGNRNILGALEAGRVVIDPFDEARLQPASVDLTLSPHFTMQSLDGLGRFLEGKSAALRVDEPAESHFRLRREVRELELSPGEFCLASCQERVELDLTLAGRLEGKSSLGRLGLAIHVTAGFIDPGFRGYPTLELVNHSRYPITIIAGMPVAQLSLFEVDGCDTPYGTTGSKYQDQGPKPAISQFHRNFKEA